MIVGIGVDIIDIHRFSDWHTKNATELARVFSAKEIEYCLQNVQRSAERFAVRFAAKEAFFKAFQTYIFSNGYENKNLLTVQREISLSHAQNGAPILIVNWDKLLPENSAHPRVHVSLSHAQQQAVAMVVLEH